MTPPAPNGAILNQKKMITLYIGLPRHGKSLMSAKLIRYTLWRNYKWYKKTGIIRYVYTNLVINDKYFIGKRERYKQFIKYWWDPQELVQLQDVDIFWDEVARHLESRDWEKLPINVKTFLQEHDKVGIDIYANTQTPRSVDVAFRRLCERVYRITKLIGSRRPSPTKPPVKIIWGLCLVQELTQESFSKEFDEEEYKKEILSIPKLKLIERRDCEIYDTRQKIRPGVYPPLRHALRYCEDAECMYHKKGRVTHW